MPSSDIKLIEYLIEYFIRQKCSIKSSIWQKGCEDLFSLWSYVFTIQLINIAMKRTPRYTICTAGHQVFTLLASTGTLQKVCKAPSGRSPSQGSDRVPVPQNSPNTDERRWIKS